MQITHLITFDNVELTRLWIVSGVEGHYPNPHDGAEYYNTYTLSDEVRQWLLDHDIVFWEHCGENQGIVGLEFAKLDDVMLFKMTWNE